MFIRWGYYRDSIFKLVKTDKDFSYLVNPFTNETLRVSDFNMATGFKDISNTFVLNQLINWSLVNDLKIGTELWFGSELFEIQGYTLNKFNEFVIEFKSKDDHYLQKQLFEIDLTYNLIK